MEVKTWQALSAMFLPERSGVGLNELLGAVIYLIIPQADIARRKNYCALGRLASNKQYPRIDF